MMAFVRWISRSGLLTSAALLVASYALQAPAFAAQSQVRSGTQLANFVEVTASGYDIQIMSATTGALVKDLGAVSGYTSDGLAISPDGQDVYLTVHTQFSLEVERITVANDQETFIADGEQPSVSPNGRFLAFATGPAAKELDVWDLSSGAVRSINLSHLLGNQTDLFQAPITWLGNGSEIAVVPGGIASDLMSNTSLPTTPESCGAVSVTDTCLIVVHAKVGDRLTARRLVLKGVSDVDVTGATGTSDLEMVAYEGHHTFICKADLKGNSGDFVRLFALKVTLPFAFDPRGTQLLYLVGHNPVALWRTQLTRHRLENAKRLNANARLAAIAW
jgi:WD40 repeat protein